MRAFAFSRELAVAGALGPRAAPWMSFRSSALARRLASPTQIQQRFAASRFDHSTRRSALPQW